VAGHVDGRRGRIEPDHLYARLLDPYGERARAAADVEHLLGTELVRHGDVGVKVVPVTLEVVVDPGQPRHGKVLVGHLWHASLWAGPAGRTEGPPGHQRRPSIGQRLKNGSAAP
jgi:hypothetical protein